MAFFSDTPAQFKQVPQYSPQIQQGLERNVLAGLGKNFDFEPIAQQARQDFQTKTLPTIAERLTSMGAAGQRNSALPALQYQAGQGLDLGLAGLRAQYGLQQQDLLSRLLGQSAQQTTYDPGHISALIQLLAPFLQAGGMGGGQLATQGLGNWLMGEQMGQTRMNKQPSVIPGAIGTAGGAILGGLLGGPAGATVGSTAGGAAGNALGSLLKARNSPTAFPGSYSVFPRQA